MQPTEEGRHSIVSEEADMPLFTSPRAFQKPTKEPIEGLETPMENFNQYSPTDKSEENNVISP